MVLAPQFDFVVVRSRLRVDYWRRLIDEGISYPKTSSAEEARSYRHVYCYSAFKRNVMKVDTRE